MANEKLKTRDNPNSQRVGGWVGSRKRAALPGRIKGGGRGRRREGARAVLLKKRRRAINACLCKKGTAMAREQRPWREKRWKGQRAGGKCGPLRSSRVASGGAGCSQASRALSKARVRGKRSQHGTHVDKTALGTALLGDGDAAGRVSGRGSQPVRYTKGADNEGWRRRADGGKKSRFMCCTVSGGTRTGRSWACVGSEGGPRRPRLHWSCGHELGLKRMEVKRWVGLEKALVWPADHKWAGRGVG